MDGDRLEWVRQIVDRILRGQPDQEESRCGFVHLYGVSAVCVVLALKRGLDPHLSAIAGMLHDIWTYKVSDSPEHGRLSALEAERILRESGRFSAAEMEEVCAAIAHHSAKGEIHGEMAELLKDADVLQHYLYNPGLMTAPQKSQRLEDILAELGLYPQES